MCRTNPNVCCQVGKCNQQFNLTICDQQVKGFKCDRTNHMHNDNEAYFYNNIPEIKPYIHPKPN